MSAVLWTIRRWNYLHSNRKITDNICFLRLLYQVECALKNIFRFVGMTFLCEKGTAVAQCTLVWRKGGGFMFCQPKTANYATPFLYQNQFYPNLENTNDSNLNIIWNSARRMKSTALFSRPRLASRFIIETWRNGISRKFWNRLEWKAGALCFTACATVTRPCFYRRAKIRKSLPNGSDIPALRWRSTLTATFCRICNKRQPINWKQCFIAQ